ncbi:uncharacterized protein AB675_10717 [Cyphellophora attinorum]|uniref:Transcription factor domain-containing protein n=1 Tax=Cyphellophora attinorum TaxID=1664694 RepID=A0A0N0NMV6_9EURO|nr:uncharacterized protein AB675_10717 [Phialophora attinorum]KPI40901.1 hypothetical protein AB675_10717 [Phialophora attinorum]
MDSDFADTASEQTNINDWKRWRVHMKGLKTMSDLRPDGFHGLGNHTALMAWWLDLVGCSVLDQVPQFEMPQDLVLLDVDHGSKSFDIRQQASHMIDMYPEMLGIMRGLHMMEGIATIVAQNSEQTEFWRDEVRGIELIGPATHFLLTTPRFQSSIDEDESSVTLLVQELLRLTCLLLLSGLKRCLSLNASDCEAIQQRFWKIWGVKGQPIAGVLQDLALWTAETTTMAESIEVAQSAHWCNWFVVRMQSLSLTIRRYKTPDYLSLLDSTAHGSAPSDSAANADILPSHPPGSLTA